MKKYHKLVVYSGGGALGKGPSKVNPKIQKEILKGWNFSNEFDAFGGTSTGSIIAASLAYGYTVEQIEEFYEDYLDIIFSAPAWWKLNPFKPKYDNSHLKKILKSKFGNKRMNELKKPLFITCTDLKYGTTKVWDNNDDVPIWYAVLTSTAAPTYFDPIDGQYGDGGMWANDPALVTLMGYKRLHNIDLSEIALLDFNTNGRFMKERKVTNLTKLDWLDLIIDFLTNGNEQSTNYFVSNLNLGKYLRLEPTTDVNFEMDSMKDAEEWTKIWLNYYELRKESIKEFFQ